jgi:hypothetical protein
MGAAARPVKAAPLAPDQKSQKASPNAKPL